MWISIISIALSTGRRLYSFDGVFNYLLTSRVFDNFSLAMSKNQNKSLSPFLTSMEEIAIDAIFAYHNESRINRTPDEYRAIAVRCPKKLQALHSIVNEMLERLSRAGISPYEICRFKAGDYGHYYVPYPTSLSFETVRQAWLKSGMRALQLEGIKLSA